MLLLNGNGAKNRHALERNSMKRRVRKQRNREIQEEGVRVDGRGKTEHCRGHQTEEGNSKSSGRQGRTPGFFSSLNCANGLSKSLKLCGTTEQRP